MGLWLLTYFVMFLCGLSLLARRFHDMDKSGWWVMLFCVPIVNLATYIYLMTKKGTPGANRFGGVPE